MLAQRAQAVRVREAIRARGLLLHDAFLKFDYDRNGLLSLAEVYGALDWLQVPNVTPADVLFFVRGATRDESISYANFMELLGTPEDAELAERVPTSQDAPAPPPHAEVALTAATVSELLGGPSSSAGASTAALGEGSAAPAVANGAPVADEPNPFSEVGPLAKLLSASRANTPSSSARSALAALASTPAAAPAPAPSAAFSAALSPSPPSLSRQRSRVRPKGEEELRTLLQSYEAEEQRLQVELERLQAAQLAKARETLESALVQSDFSFYRQAKLGGGLNPRTTRTSRFFDFSRGQAGGQEGTPHWMEGRGRWLCVRQGDSRIPCYRGTDGYVLLRVPFSKNGGGMHLNSFTVTLHVKLKKLRQRGLVATAGWDSWAKAAENDEKAQLSMSERGALCAVDSSSDERCLKPNRWHALSLVVEAGSTPMLHLYLDGELASTIKTPKASCDGQYSLRRQLAIFFMRSQKRSVSAPVHDPSAKYLRSATVHSRALDGEHIRREHGILHSLLIEDAIGAVPAYMRELLSQAHAAEPFKSTRAMRQHLKGLLESAMGAALQLWRALLACDTVEAARLCEEMRPSTLAVCARWRRRQAATGDVEPVEETVAPYGETLLHAAAFAGNEPLLRQLLEAGAPPSRRGVLSSCTALHAAAAAGSVGACKALLAAGCKVDAASATKRTALHMACVKGLVDVAELLVKEGGADLYSTFGGAESAMGLLRRLGRPDSLDLLRALDALAGGPLAGETSSSAKLASAGGTEVGSASNGGGDAEDEESDDADEAKEDPDDDLVAQLALEAKEERNGGLRVGQRIEARYQRRQRWYPGKLTKVANGAVDIAYDDGDREYGLPIMYVKAEGGAEASAGPKPPRVTVDADDPCQLLRRLKDEAERRDDAESGDDDDGGDADAAEEAMALDDTRLRDQLLREAKEAAKSASTARPAESHRSKGYGFSDDDDNESEGEEEDDESEEDFHFRRGRRSPVESDSELSEE